MARDGDAARVEVCVAAVITQESDGEEGTGGQGGEDMAYTSFGGKEWDVEPGGVSGLNCGAVRQPDVNGGVGCDRYEGRAYFSHHEVVASSPCVGYGGYGGRGGSCNTCQRI